MLSNYDTYRRRRQEVLQDLQRISRRANGIAPVANYEDIGIIRNTIRPALEFDKFAAVVEFIPDPAQFTLILSLGGIDKLAGIWGDIWEGMKGGAGRLWEGAKTLGRDVIWPTLKLPYSIPKSIYEHVGQAWRPGGGLLSNIGRSAVGAVSGVMEPLESIATGGYRAARDIGTGSWGMIPGVELGFQKALRTPYLGGALRTADVAGETLAGLAPSLAAFLIPGGQAAGAARIGLTGAKYLTGGEALLRQWPHTGGGIGTGLRATLMGETPGVAPAPQPAPTLPQDQQAYNQMLANLTPQLMSPTGLAGMFAPGATLEQLRGMGSLIGQLPRGILMPPGYAPA